jgi:hypothetical protein
MDNQPPKLEFDPLMSIRSSGSLIAYSTSAGKTSDARSASGLSFYTQYLVNSLAARPKDMNTALQRAKSATSDASGTKQVPAVYDEMVGDFLLSSSPAPPNIVPDKDNHGYQSVIPPIVKVGAPIGSRFQYTYTNKSLVCISEYTKVSTTEWYEQPSPGDPDGCLTDVVLFKYSERESTDGRYFLLYDEGRQLFVRLTKTEKQGISPAEWRLISRNEWNAVRMVKRLN